MTRAFRGLTLPLVAFVLVALAGPATAQPAKSINLAMLAGFKEDVVRALLPSFEQQTKIKVNLDTAPYGELYKKQLLSLAGGAARYDVLFIDEPWVPTLAEFLHPLDDLAKQVEPGDFVPTTLAAGSYKGKIYALPVDPNVQLLIYRKDLFDQRGFKPPATWDETLALAKQLHDPGKDVAGFVMTAGSDVQTFAYLTLFLWSWGVELLDANNRAAVNTPAGKAAAEFYVELMKYCPPGVKGYTFADVTKTMQLGKAAMAVQWASGARPLEDKEKSMVAGKLGYAVVPRQARQTPMRGVWTIGIARDSKSVDAAWEFARWLAGRDFGLQAVKHPATSSAIHNARYSVLRSPTFTGTLAYADAILKSLEIAKERNRIPQFPDIQEQLRLVGAKITTAEVSPADGIKELEAAINRIMAK
ncbi:MAG TPA: sugar ABC transporter substrate-binding protein [Methylomirabilota bacterium]|jgi:ABC-type glycerol-3-phosphate transport system substrate-binding protein|nr:sugar ABC transporter substrate-binding protein [Methylomirabilota bacterium]